MLSLNYLKKKKIKLFSLFSLLLSKLWLALFKMAFQIGWRAIFCAMKCSFSLFVQCRFCLDFQMYRRWGLINGCIVIFNKVGEIRACKYVGMTWFGALLCHQEIHYILSLNFKRKSSKSLNMESDRISNRNSNRKSNRNSNRKSNLKKYSFKLTLIYS